MQIEIVDQFSPALDELAVRCPEATFYHTGVWIESLAHAFPSMRFQCLLAISGAEVIGYLPFFLLKRGPFGAIWSLPFGTYGGPVSLAGDDVRNALVASFTSIKNRRGVHEIGLVDLTGRVDAVSLRHEDASTHVLELSGGFDALFEGAFEKSKRRQTRKAIKEGLAVTEAGAVDEVSKYYEIYARRVGEWGEKFHYPEKLFTELFARGRGSVKLFTARKGEELLGGHFNFYFRDVVIAWNGVVRDTADGTQASTLLYSECIRHACENGYLSYNLGSSLGKRSLIDYKESLGGVLRNYRTLRWRSATVRLAEALRGLAAKR